MEKCLAFERASASVPACRSVRVSVCPPISLSGCLGACVRIRAVKRQKERAMGDQGGGDGKVLGV